MNTLMTDFQTTPLLFVTIVLGVSALLAAAGGWRAITVEPAEDEEAETHLQEDRKATQSTQSDEITDGAPASGIETD